MAKRRLAEPPALPEREWSSTIQATDHGYLVYLNHGSLRYGPEAYGWTRLTYAGARRTAARQLRLALKRERRLEIKDAYMKGGPSLRQLKRELRGLNWALDPERHGQVLASDVRRRAELRKLLGPVL